jgi:DNA-binding response OmpR family regulator
MYKILAVDDEPRIAEVLHEFLTKAGFDVKNVLGGGEAIEIIKSDIKIDLMVLDMKMPKVTGFDVIKEMERISKKLPTIILTGSIDAEKYLGGLRALGYTREDILHKPVDLFELLDAVKKKLQQQFQ